MLAVSFEQEASVLKPTKTWAAEDERNASQMRPDGSGFGSFSSSDRIVLDGESVQTLYSSSERQNITPLYRFHKQNKITELK